MFSPTQPSLLPALQVLDAPETLEAAVDHDGHAGAQGLALLHAVEEEQTAADWLFSADR